MNNVTPFGRQNIPIIGQSYEFSGWYPTAIIRCNCEAKVAINLVGFGGIAKCVACGKARRLSRAVFDAATGQIGLEIQDIVVHDEGLVQTPTNALGDGAPQVES